VGRLADLVGRVRQLEVVHLGRLGEPLEVLLAAEDRRAALGLVAADPLEHARAVVESVGEDVRGRLLPGDELAVLPDQFCLFHSRESMP
jgi:hypothetical protein